MNLSLTKVKVHPDMSEETNCFSAEVHLDGKKVGEVKNAGHGGSHQYHWTNRDIGTKIQKWAMIQNLEFDFEKLDQIIDKLLLEFEEKRQLKRWCKKEIVFRLKGDKVGNWRSVKGVFTPAIKTALVNKFGDQLERIANESV